MDAEVVAEPDDGGAAECGGAGGVKGAVWAQGEWGPEWVGGEGGFEGGLGRRVSGCCGGNREVCEG